MRIEFPELFDDDIATMPDFKQEIDDHGPIGDTEIKKIEGQLEQWGFNNENFETKIIDGELKVVPKNNSNKDESERRYGW